MTVTMVVKLGYLFKFIVCLFCFYFLSFFCFVFFFLRILRALFCDYIKHFLQHPLEHNVQSCCLNLKEDLMTLEMMERKSGYIIKGVEQLPVKRDQRRLSSSVWRGESEECDWSLQIHIMVRQTKLTGKQCQY